MNRIQRHGRGVSRRAHGRDGIRRRNGRNALRSAQRRAHAQCLLAQEQRARGHCVRLVAFPSLQRLQLAHTRDEETRRRLLFVRRLQSNRETCEQTRIAHSARQDQEVLVVSVVRLVHLLIAMWAGRDEANENLSNDQQFGSAQKCLDDSVRQRANSGRRAMSTNSMFERRSRMVRVVRVVVVYQRLQTNPNEILPKLRKPIEGLCGRESTNETLRQDCVSSSGQRLPK